MKQQTKQQLKIQHTKQTENLNVILDVDNVETAVEKEIVNIKNQKIRFYTLTNKI